MARLANASEPTRFIFYTIVTFFIFVSSVISGPAGIRSTSKCVSFCKDSKHFAYETGTTYVYDYATDISSSVIDGSNQESRIHLRAAAEITAISSCEFQLQLKNVRIEDSDPKNANDKRPLEGARTMVADMESRAIRFAFQDGKIEQICSQLDDPVWVVNVKRGLLSVLQNTMNNMQAEQTFQETDVSGQCLTTYEPSGSSWGGSQTYRRVKDLTKCNYRHNQFTALQSVPYASNSLIQGIPLLSGVQECTQTIRYKKIEQVNCREEHKFQPFEKDGSGAHTTVVQTLVYSREYQSTHPSDISFERKSTLLYEAQSDHGGKSSDITTALSALESLERDNEVEVESDAANQFIHLVQLMRELNYDGLQMLFSRAHGDPGRKYLLDALPLVGTAPSLKLMTEFLLKGTLTQTQEDAWLTSVAFIKEPHVQMISALMPLLENEPRKQAMLGISALINSYCKENRVCTEEVVQDALKKIISHIGTGCRTSANYDQEETRRIVVALKAIANAGRVPEDDKDEHLSNLYRCSQDKSNPIEIRLASIDAFRRMSCTCFDNKPMLNLYTDMQENTEVRIKSYLSVMRCPDRQIIDSVKDTLYTDAVNQVGSFVWTHLTNLQETSSPDKQTIRNLLANDFLKNKFNTDARKFSRNYEGALYWEEINAGGNVDANVIFTPDSFIPRSAMVNLTVLAFGQAINLVEFDARVHSLEQLLEPVFGPQGYFPDTSMTDVLHSIRKKRDVSNNEIERLGSVYEQATKGMDASPGGSFSTKIFGHEILYKNFEFSDKGSIPTLYDESGKNWFDISRILNNLSTGKKTEFTNSNVMMDISYTIATSAGIPLSLSIQSATTVRMAATGRFDVARFLDRKEFEIQGSLQPSASLKVDGSLTVHLGQLGQQIKSGLKLQNTLHSSTSVKGHILMKGTKVIHASLSLPQDKQEIFEASSQIFIISPSGNPDAIETGPIGLPKFQHKVCTSERFSYIFGVKLCGEIDVAEDSTFPLITPSKAALYLEKTDTFTSYEFDYKFDNKPSSTEVSITFNTPGSLVDRKFSTHFNLDTNHGKLVAGFETPTKTFKAEGLYSKAQKNLQVTVDTAKERIFFFNSNLRTVGRRIEPNFLVKYYKTPLAEFTGIINLPDPRDESSRSNFDFSLKYLTQKPIVLKGDVTKNGEKYDTIFEIDSYMLSGSARSQFRLKPGHFSAKSSMHYSWENAESKNLEINAKVQRTKKGALTRFNAAASFFCPQSPDLNFEFAFDNQKSTGFCENTARFTLGKYTWDAHTLYNKQVTREQQELNIQLSLAVPKQGIDWNFEFFNFVGKNNVTTKVSGRTTPDNEIRAQMEYQTEAETLVKKRLTAEASWPDCDYALRSAVIEKSAGEFEAEFILIPNKDPEMKATITYINRSNNMKLDHSLEFRARGFTDAPFFGSAALSSSDKQSHLGGTFEIEGKKPGRWSTSLDYNIVKINTHKIEGKLTLNDKKYNGEINYRQTKSGERIATFDFQLEKHIVADMKFTGELPLPFTLSMSLTPDVDENSESKLVFYGTLSDEAIHINTDYFGESFAVTGRVQDTNFEVDAVWGQQQRFKLSVNAPSFSFTRTAFSAKLETPFKGLQISSLVVAHQFSGSEMSTTIRGQIEEKYSEFSSSSLLSTPESRFYAVIDISEYPKLEGIITIGETGNQKSFELVAKRGEEVRKFTFEFSRLQGGYDTRLGFSGCTVLPQVYLEFQHQMSEQMSTGIQIQWIPVKSSRRQIVLKLTSQMKPFLHTFLLFTPWKNFEKLEASVGLKNRNLVREFEINLDGSLEFFPVTAVVKINGELSEFHNEVLASWKSSQLRNQVRISSVGQIVDADNTVIHNSIEFPDNKYELNVSSKKDGVTNSATIDITANGEQSVAGVTWHYIDEGKSIEATAWGQTPSHLRSSFEFKHERSEKKFKILCNIVKSTNSLFQLFTNFEETNDGQFDAQIQLKSIFEQVPTIELQSRHNMVDPNAISHMSDLRISPMPSYIWGVQNGEFHTNVRFNINDDKYITGRAVFGQETAEIRGEFLNSAHKRNIKISVNPTFAERMEIISGYDKHSDSFTTFFSASSGGEEILHFKIKGGKQQHKISGDLDFHYSNGPHIVGTVLLDWIDQVIEMNLRNHDVSLISFHLSSLVALGEGESRFEIESSLHPALKKIKLSLTHSVRPGGFEMEGKYENQESQYNINGVGVWSEENKSMRWSLGGQWDGSLNIVITGLDELTATLIYEGKELYKVDAQYSQVKGEYALGKHTIRMLVNKNYQFVFTLGVDLTKALLDIRTPFLHWTSLILKGEFQFEEDPKILSFSVQKEQDTYKMNIRVNSDIKNGNIVIGVESPFEGYRKLEGKLVYAIDKRSEIMFTATRESQNVVLQAKWSPSDVLLSIQTPIRIAKQISLTGNWELFAPEKEFKLKTTLNEDTYEVQSNWNIKPKKGSAQIKVKIYETYDVSASYDFTTEYNILLSLKTSGERQNIGGRVALTNGSIHVEAISPFIGYEKFGAKAGYKKVDLGYEGAFEWDINNKLGSIDTKLILEHGKVVLNLETPWRPWRKIKSTLKYDLGQRKALSFEAERDDGKKLELHTTAYLEGKIIDLKSSASAGYELSLVIPIEGYERYQVKTQYARQRGTHKVNISAGKNEDKISGNIVASFETTKGFTANIQADILAPYFNLNRSINLVFGSNQKKTLSAQVNLEGATHTVDGSFELTKSNGKLEVTTSFPRLRIFKVSAHHERGKRFNAILEVNEQKTELKSEYQFQGVRQTKVSLELKSPISGFKNVAAEAHFSLKSGDLDTSFNFQNDWVRYIAKLNGSYTPDAGTFKLQVNSPIYNYEQIVLSSNYTIEPSSGRIFLGMERNTQPELAIETTCTGSQLQIVLLSKIANYVVESTSIINWSTYPFNIEVVVATGGAIQRGGLFTDIQGFEKGTIEIELPVQGWESLKFGWNLDASINKGEATVHFDITKFGKYAARASWENRKWKSANFELWLKCGTESEERGMSAQYSIIQHEKFEASLSYKNKRPTQTFKISSSLTASKGTKIIEFKLETPFPSVQEIAINAKLSNAYSTDFEIAIKHNQESILNTKTSYYINPKSSWINVDLNAPVLCEPFQANATYDLTTSHKKFNIFFNQAKYVVSITSSAIVPENSNEIELHMNVDSNVPLITITTSGTIKAAYKVIKSDDTRELTVSLDSTHLPKWKVIGTIRPSTNFFAKLEVDTPTEHSIPSSIVQLNWRGNFVQGISSDVSIKIGTIPEVKATFSLGSNHVWATFNSGISGFEELSFEGVSDSGTESGKEVKITVLAMNKNLTAKINIQTSSESSVKASFLLESSLEIVPRTTFEIVVEENGNVAATGTWGTRSISVRGSVVRNGRLSLWKAASTRFTLFVDSVETFSGELSHLIGTREYSFNTTVGTDYVIQSYIHLDSPKTISTMVQFGKKVVKFNGETGPGKFAVSLSSPWTKDFSTNGFLVSRNGEVNAKLSFMYDQVQSKLEGSVTRNGNVHGVQVSIDIPMLKQKADCIFTVAQTVENGKESTDVKIKLNLVERRLMLQSVWEYFQFDDPSYGKFQQRDIQLTFSLPGSSFSDIRVHTSVKQPVGSCASLSVETLLYTNSQTSKFALGYEIPVGKFQRIGTRIFVDSSYVSEEPLEFSFGASHVSLAKFDANLLYKSNQVKLLWDFSTLPQFKLETFANLPNFMPDSTPYKLEIEGVFDLSREIKLKANISCSSCFNFIELAINRDNEGWNTRLVIDSPRFIGETLDFSAKMYKKSSHRYFIDVSGLKGKKSFEVSGLTTVLSNSFTISTKMSGTFGTHFSQLHVNKNEQGNYEAEISAESMSFLKGKKVVIVGDLKPTENGFETNVECRTRKSTHAGSFSISFDRNRGAIHAKIESPDFLPIVLEANWKLQPSSIGGKFEITVNDVLHRIEMNGDIENYEVLLNIVCPYIPSKEFNVHLKFIVPESDFDILGDFKFDKSHWRLEGTSRYEHFRNMESKFEIRTTFEFLDRLTLAIKSVPEEFHVEIYTPVEAIPNVMLGLSGLSSMEEGLWTDMSPRVIIGLPCVSYSLSVTSIMPTNVTQGDFGIKYEKIIAKTQAKSRYEINLKTSSIRAFDFDMENVLEMRFKLKSPFKIVEKVELLLGGKLGWESGAEFKSLGELNGQIIKFELKLRRETDGVKLSSELATPFEDLEKYTFFVRLENYEEIGSGHSIHIDFQKPDWAEPIQLELDYRYRAESFANMEGEFSMSAPFFGIYPFILHAESMVKNSGYSSIIEGKWETSNPFVKLDIGWGLDKTFAIFESKVGRKDKYHTITQLDFTKGDHNVNMDFKTEFQKEPIISVNVIFLNPESSVEGKITIKTIWEKFRSADAIIRISPFSYAKESFNFEKLLNTLDTKLGLQLNNRKIMNLELVNKNGKRVLEIHNPLRPVSLTIKYDKESSHKLRLNAEFCWNLKNPTGSTIGTELVLCRTSTGKDIFMKVQAAHFGSLSANISHLLTSSKLDQNVQLGWDLPQMHRKGEIGYSIMFNDNSNSRDKKYDGVVKIFTPWRSMKVESRITSTEKESIRFAQIQWDAKKDPSKKIGFELVQKKTNAWRSFIVSKILTVSYSGLDNDIIVTSETGYKYNQFQYVEMTIKPTVHKENDLKLRLVKLTEESDSTGYNFVLTQPTTNIFLELQFEQSEVEQNFNIKYKDVRGVLHLANLKKTLTKNGITIDADAGQEDNLFKIFYLDISPNDDQYLLKLKTFEAEFDASLKQNLTCMDLNLKYGIGKQLRISAGMPNKKEISVKVWRDEYGKNIYDFIVALRLNTSQLISSTVVWRPELFDQIQVSLVSINAPQTFREVFGNAINLFWTVISEEVTARWDFLEPEIKLMIEDVIKTTRNEFRNIMTDVYHTWDFINELYDKNIFYSKNVAAIFESSYRAVYSICEKTTKGLTEIVKSTVRIIGEFAADVFEFWHKYGSEIEEIIMNAWDETEEFIVSVWEENFQSVSNFFDYLEEVYEMIEDVIEGRIEELEEKILAVSLIRKLIKLYQDYSAWIEELPIQDYIDDVTNFFEEKIWRPLERQYKPYIDAINKIFEGDSLPFLEMPPLPYLRFVLKKVRDASSHVMRIIEAEQKVKTLVRQSLKSLDGMLQRHVPTVAFVWDIDSGRIEYQQSLVFVMWEDFTQYPQWKRTQQDEDDLSKMSDLFYEILDNFRHARPVIDMNIRDILPPFGAHAVMAGDYHYFTFDKKYFRFAGECSYVLAADLLHQNFSLIANYEQNDGDIRKKSYTLISNEKFVEIDTSNFKVTLDGRKVELPLEVGPTFIRRQPSGLEVFDSRGFQMSCSLNPSVCTVSVSGWYFGKLAGLLGTYDNEDWNDFKTPDGQIVTDVSTFAHSWRVGKNSGGCRAKNFARNNVEKTDVDGICSQLFSDISSPLRPCFNKVDTAIYTEMCMYDTSVNVNSAFRQESACTAISAYVSECQKSNIDVWMPPSCVRCKLEDGTALTSGENATLEANGPLDTPKSSDVILLLQESSCLNGISISEAMTKLDLALKAEGLVENRYAIVGFGGKGVHWKPHIRTSSSQVWAHSTLFKIPDNIQMDGDENGNVYEAIEYAASLGFRAGVSKNIIALTCGDERCGDADQFADTLTLLIENDIKFHILAPKEFTMKGNNKKQVDLYGMDINGVYTSHPSKRGNVEPDTSLKRQINLPKDLCTPLAMETNGTRFNVLQPTNKRFLDIWSRRISQTSQPSECQRCECVPDKNGRANLMCHHCVSPTLQRFMEDWQKYQYLDMEELLASDLMEQEQSNDSF